MQLMNFNMCIGSCNHHEYTVSIQTLPLVHKTALCYYFVVVPPHPTAPITLGTPCYFSFALWKMVIEWNHIDCSHLILLCMHTLSIMPSDFSALFCVSVFLSLILLSDIQLGGCTTVCLSIHLLKDFELFHVFSYFWVEM